MKCEPEKIVLHMRTVVQCFEGARGSAKFTLNMYKRNLKEMYTMTYSYVFYIITCYIV